MWPADGFSWVTSIISEMEAEGAPHGLTLRILDAVSAVLTLVLVPWLWWAFPADVFGRIAVWGVGVFGVFGIPAGLVPLPCHAAEQDCRLTAAEEVQSNIHDGTSIISTTALIIGAAAAAWALRRTGPRWMVRAGWVTVAVQILTGLGFAAAWFADSDDVSGVLQRIEVVGIGAWVACLGIYAATHGIPARARRRGGPAGDVRPAG